MNSLPMGCLFSRSSASPTASATASKRVRSSGSAGQAKEDRQLGVSRMGGFPIKTTEEGPKQAGGLDAQHSSSVTGDMVDQSAIVMEEGSEKRTKRTGQRSNKYLRESPNEKQKMVSESSSLDVGDEDIISILMGSSDANNHKDNAGTSGNSTGAERNSNQLASSGDIMRSNRCDSMNELSAEEGARKTRWKDGDEYDRGSKGQANDSSGLEFLNESEMMSASMGLVSASNRDELEEPNLELLRQYIAVDYEISLLEDRDALRVYHEKIEQLEQLERELDMINLDVEEVASRNEVVREEGEQQYDGQESGTSHSLKANDKKEDGQASFAGSNRGDRNPSRDKEAQQADKDKATAMSSTNLMVGSLLKKFSLSSTKTNQKQKAAENGGGFGDKQVESLTNNMSLPTPIGNAANRDDDSDQGQYEAKKIGGTGGESPQIGEKAAIVSGADSTAEPNSETNGDTAASRLASARNAAGSTAQLTSRGAYTSVEEVFNRKIILERERDKLKKEVQMAIIGCDKLQQRYKKRDEILDELFDGRTGNGLENHLEQQLNWLLEQKHYVDQVFYVWKRAETLTSQTCEQFASALELLKRWSKSGSESETDEEREALVKSVGDLLIKSRKSMEQAQKYNPNVDAPFFTDSETERLDKIIDRILTNSISHSEYGQILTVIQFAYKRAVSIRLWLEQILQTTIARDSFELAEEYKWIAIQLRKERISLIKLKLASPRYRGLVLSMRKQLEARQQSAPEAGRKQEALEINRDSGVGSETNDLDIEDDIYRVLELNRGKLEQALSRSESQRQLQVDKRVPALGEYQKPISATDDRGSPKVNRSSSSGAPDGANYEEDLSATIMRRGLERRSAMLSVSGATKDNEGAASSRGSLKVATSALEVAGAGTSSSGGSGFAPAPNSASETQPDGSEKQPSSASLSSGIINRTIDTPTRLRVQLDEEAKQSLLKLLICKAAEISA